MKDVKIQNIQPTVDPKAAGKAAKKEQLVGDTFDETLNTTVAENKKLGSAVDIAKKGEADSLSDQLNREKEIFDQMMQAKQSMMKLYQKLKEEG